MQVLHTHHHITVVLYQVDGLYNMVINVFIVFGMAVFQQFTFAAQETIHHFTDRRKVSFQYDQLFTQLGDMGKGPWVFAMHYFLFYFLNTVAQFFHYHEVMVNDHVQQNITKEVGCTLPHFSIGDAQLVPQCGKHIPVCILLETDHNIFGQYDADLLLFYCMGFLVIVQHIQQAEDAVIGFIKFGPLVDAQDIFNNERVNIKIRTDRFHICLAQTVHIDPGGAAAGFVLKAIFYSGQLFFFQVFRIVIKNMYMHLLRFFPVRLYRRVYR